MMLKVRGAWKKIVKIVKFSFSLKPLAFSDFHFPTVLKGNNTCLLASWSVLSISGMLLCVCCSRVATVTVCLHSTGAHRLLGFAYFIQGM